MRKILIILLFFPLYLSAQTTMFGDRLFVSIDKQDTLAVQFRADGIYLKGDKSLKLSAFNEKWLSDSVRYGSKSYVLAAVATKQPQLSGTGFVKVSGTTITYDNSSYQPAGSYMLNSDTSRYISKSQARKDIHDSIAPLRVDIIELQADTNYVKSFIRNHTQVEFTIVASDTTVINIGSILTHELINIENYIIKLPSNYQSGSIRIMPKDFSLFVDNGRTIDTNGGQGIGISILFALVDTDIRMSIINTNAETGTIKFTINNIYADGVLINGVWNDNGVWLDSQPMF